MKNNLYLRLFFTVLCLGVARSALAQSSYPISDLIPTITVRATTPFASELTGDAGVFTVYRAGNTNNDINVFYSLSGTASNGVDYVTLPNWVTIPAGVTSVPITVTPIDDGLTDGDETVVLDLRQPPYLIPATYLIGFPGEATVTIVESTIPPPTNSPPAVKVVSPADGTLFVSPANIPIYAAAGDLDGSVSTVEFFANDASLGIVTNSLSTVPLELSGATLITSLPLYTLTWSNVPPGNYALTAKATDDQGAATISAPVNITVTDNPLPPIVTIYAVDPIASEGPGPVLDPLVSGSSGVTQVSTNTATFVIRRWGDTNSDLNVFYAISGTASNGVDYLTLPGFATIPAGRHAARVVVQPIDDALPEPIETVVLTLTQPPTLGPRISYWIGVPAKAAAVILDNDSPTPVVGPLPDKSLYFTQPASNGVYYSFECSTNLVNWTPLFTNIVTDGAISYIDPDPHSTALRFYRAMPVLSIPPE